MSEMNIYLAPLEGITRYNFRNAINDMFGEGVYKYYTPFFAPHTKRTMNNKEMKDVLPENNKGVYLVPQILTNNSQDFLSFERDMYDLFGYEEVNINVGCPSGTVVPKGRGAGLLKDSDVLDAFLYEIFCSKKRKVSIKTRLGMWESDEFYEILEVYNKYELEELIIHPRVREEFYKGRPHWDMYKYALENSKNPLCYSGDIYSCENLASLKAELKTENIGALMLGRGMVSDPSLARQLKGGNKMNRRELKAYHDRLYSEFKELLHGQTMVLHKMKELWLYLIRNYEEERLLKKVQKTKNYAEYDSVVTELIAKYPEK